MPSVEIIPFRPGHRPTDEARHPWLGSSDAVAFLDGECYLLLALGNARPDDGLTVAIGGREQAVEPRVFADGEPVLRPCALGADRPYVVRLDRADFAGDYSFANQFMQAVDVRVRLIRDGAAVASGDGRVDVYDVESFGTLYERIVRRVVVPDTARQAPGLSHAYHPWFPVLLIGAHKADLYTRALVDDIVHKRQNLSDPGWLVRVGLYLELLTGLGVIEAVRDDLGDLLTGDERAAFEGADNFAEIRRRVNVAGWKRVWDLRGIQVFGAPRAGPVSALNLLAKRRATLEFLHTHHEDLKDAIALAGPNPHNAQETWHRVFRDAERAVLRQTPEAFPELGHLPDEVTNFMLWHRVGHLRLGRALRMPGPLPRLLGDQDGLFASACNQYRASMNHVADWAREHGLMDHSGEECVPRQVSLLEAHMNQPTRVGRLQRRDGYDTERLEVGAELPAGYEPPLDELRDRLVGTPLFAFLADEEIDLLTRTARPLTFGPLERIIVQGQPGGSVYVVVEGTVEVMIRREDGVEVNLGTRAEGTILGEMSLLTGEPRSATVRAVDGAVVYEIGRRQYEPILAGRPDLVESLRRAMEARLERQSRLLSRHDADARRSAFTRTLRRLVSAT